MPAIIPIPQVDVSVREATLDDVPFIDRLQNENRKSAGFLARSWIESKIKAGQVLIAEEVRGRKSEVGEEEVGGQKSEVSEGISLTSDLRPLTSRRSDRRPLTSLGYVISQDKYLKREELGLIVQLCVDAGARRKLIGATLLKAAFDRAAYGCLLFCCWCAQDIEANRFWESMGFVPLAYRGGSERRGQRSEVRGQKGRGRKAPRVHIFWQKRIREGDVGGGATWWWYPTETTGGAMGEARLVFPISPDKHWSDEMPVILPAAAENAPKLEGPKTKQPRKKPAALMIAPRRLWFAPPAPTGEAGVAKAEKKPAEKKVRKKNDPKLVAAARELRDRWLEHVNAGETMLESAGKYDVSRTPSAVEGSRSLAAPSVSMPALSAAEGELKALPHAA